jgi:hypothetical protein
LLKSKGQTTQFLTKTLKWLSLLEGRWLLVLDNVDGEEVSGNIKELYISWKSQAYSMESVVLPQPPSPEIACETYPFF